VSFLEYDPQGPTQWMQSRRIRLWLVATGEGIPAEYIVPPSTFLYLHQVQGINSNITPGGPDFARLGVNGFNITFAVGTNAGDLFYQLLNFPILFLPGDIIDFTATAAYSTWTSIAWGTLFADGGL